MPTTANNTNDKAYRLPPFDEQVTSVSDARDKLLLDQYLAGLRALKPAGQGNGTHIQILRVANAGARAGAPGCIIFDDIRENLPPGDRPVSDREIRDAVNKAMASGGYPIEAMIPPVAPRISRDLLAKLIAQGAGAKIDDISRASPLQIPVSPREQRRLVLETLYSTDEHLFIGDKYDTEVQPARVWLKRLAAGIVLGPHIIPNPLTGNEGLTKDGKPSMRCDACVSSLRFAVVEFDNMPLEDQLAFWFAVNLPVAALLLSGGKSVHAWLRVDAPDIGAWKRDIEGELYAGRLIPLGVDASCKNPSRLSRMPGCLREDTGVVQRLLYLAPQGRAVRA